MDHARSREVSSAYSSPTFGKDGSFDVDKPVGSMSISPCGRDVVLASRQGLHIIDLDSPWSPPRHLPHLTPWEVADVQWSPFPSRDYWVVSTSNQKALVWNLAMSTPHASIEHYLHAHSRAITDINFSAHHPDVLATCAVDSFVHCWDLRNPARPAVSFCDWFAGATQVKWNRQDPHVIASSHDKFLRIWDNRKGAHPLHSIEAHDTKIYGIDWNRTRANAIVTCSLDKTIKFWDYSTGNDGPERVIQTPFPVWRARHTPFGTGLLAMPQRGDNNLYLYDRLSKNTPGNTMLLPVRSFEGHEDQVKEVLWRPRGSIENGVDNREFQLVSWGADKVLRLHHVDEDTLAEVGYEKGMKVVQNYNLTRRNAPYKTFREEPLKLGVIKQKAISTNNSLQGDRNVDLDARGSRNMTVASSALGGWSNGGFLHSRPGMRSKTAARKDIDPIAWMRGVKIGKREAGLDQSGTSIASPNYRADKNMEEFENLGEEIAHVGSKFSKVDFKDINVHNRYIKFSMHGSWGQNETTKYLECRLEFPKTYPSEAAPIFSIEKTASLDDAIISRLKDDVKTIESAYLGFGRSSLEALIRYLHGDQSLEDAIAWTKEEETSIIDFGEAGNGSSSEEEDDLGNYASTQNDEFGLTDSGILSSSNANANVPLPKACGAMWSKDGRLVCFFPPKEDNKALSLVGSLGLDGSGLLAKGRRKMLGGFGTFYPRPNLRSKTSSAGTLDGSESESELDLDNSSVSSSNSSYSSRDASSRAIHLSPEHAFRSDVHSFPRFYKGPEEPPKSNESVSMSRSGPSTSKNLVSIHNLESILPSKRHLAQEYITDGPNPSLHNSKIAQKAGFSDLADVWSLIDMLLKDEVPLETVAFIESDGSEVDNSPSSPYLKIQGCVNTLPSGITSSARSLATRGSVKWGQHPLGNSFLIQQLFSHFEQLADVQMLAMMSCILSSSSSSHNRAVTASLNSATGRSIVSTPSNSVIKPLPKLTIGQTSYFPSDEVAFSLLSINDNIRSGATKGRRAKTEPSSLASSFGATNSDPVTTQSAGITPPSSYKPRRGIERSDSNTHTNSSSPERLRQLHRSTSNLASTFASLSRPFSLSASASSSPPIAFNRKRTSPVESYGGPGSQSVTWGATSIFGKSLSSMDESKSTDTPSELRISESSPLKKAADKNIEIKVSLKNQDQFHNEGYSSISFLESNDEWRYQASIAAYAGILSIWNLPLARAEILKYNTRTMNKTELSPKGSHDHGSVLSIGKRTTTTSLAHLNHGNLELKRRSDDYRDSKLPVICILCELLAQGRGSSCLSCGHFLHSACRTLLLSDPEVGNGMCISGCDCYCNEQIHVIVDWPVDELQFQRSSAPSTIREVVESEKIWESPWDEGEDIAYESLARNLGKHGKSKRVQSWKGRETRANSVGH